MFRFRYRRLSSCKQCNSQRRSHTPKYPCCTHSWEETIAEAGFFFCNDGFSYNDGNHIKAAPSNSNAITWHDAGWYQSFSWINAKKCLAKPHRSVADGRCCHKGSNSPQIVCKHDMTWVTNRYSSCTPKRHPQDRASQIFELYPIVPWSSPDRRVSQEIKTCILNWEQTRL